MSKINILDSSIYNLIAAGEVVERPVSVVKELVENSIDAGAKNITIEIKDGGTSFIQVSDDGSGIEEDDFKPAFLPHATSKIKNANDLNSIGTLGFRGEALASIASVAKVTLTSKTESSELGTSLRVEGGKFGEITKVGTSKGTTITVEDLFYCVPARAKFLKKNKTEEQEITNIMNRTILAHPDINFTYIVDGKKNMSSLGSSKKEALYSVYGKEVLTETLEVNASRENISVTGFIGKPTFSKSNRTYQTLIINGRYVINLTVQTAVANAFGDFLMKRQYPFFVLYLSVPKDEIDVNVHPNKLDVRFLKSSLVYSVVFEAVSRALYNMDYVKEINDGTNANVVEKKTINNEMLSVDRPKSNEIDKAGVNLNPFSSNFKEMKSDEKEKISNLVIDTMLSNSENETLRDNFGLGSRLLERINEKVNEEGKLGYESENYSLDNKNQEQTLSKNTENFAYDKKESNFDDMKYKAEDLGSKTDILSDKLNLDFNNIVQKPQSFKNENFAQ